MLCCRPVAPASHASHTIPSHPAIVGGKGEASDIRRVPDHDVVQPPVTHCLSSCCVIAIIEIAIDIDMDVLQQRGPLSLFYS